MDALGVRHPVPSSGPMARAAEDGARRPADDLAARLIGHESRRAGTAWAVALRPASGSAEPGALQACPLRRDLSPHPGAARRPERQRAAAAMQDHRAFDAAEMRRCTASSPTWHPALATGYRRPPFGNAVLAIRRHRRGAPAAPALLPARCGGATGSARRRRCSRRCRWRSRRPTRAARDNTLRVAFRVAETGFDPVAIGDENSNRVAACIFEIAADLRPPGAAGDDAAAHRRALPEVADDFRSFTFRIRPGIFFADDPVSRAARASWWRRIGLFAIKRYYDPRNNSELLYLWENAGVLDLTELRERALKEKEALRLRPRGRRHPRAGSLHRFACAWRSRRRASAHLFAQTGLAGAIAREVVEPTAPTSPRTRWAPAIQARRLAALLAHRACSRQPDTASASSRPRRRRAIAQAQARARWRAAPAAGDRVEISVIEESQPRWLASFDGSLDQIELPVDFAPVAVPRRRAAPSRQPRRAAAARAAARHGDDLLQHACAAGRAAMRRRRWRCAAPSRWPTTTTRNCVRCATPGHRGAPTIRALHLGLRERLPQRDERARPGARHGPARSLRLPRPQRRWLARTVRRLAAGAAPRPPAARSRGAATSCGASTWRVGLRIEFDVATWPDLLKRSRNATLMMWGLRLVAQSPDGGFFLGIAYGPNSGESNDARFALPAFDRLFERQSVLPDGAERLALMREGKNMLAAHMPYKAHVHHHQRPAAAARVVAAPVRTRHLGLHRGRHGDIVMSTLPSRAHPEVHALVERDPRPELRPDDGRGLRRDVGAGR